MHLKLNFFNFFSIYINWRRLSSVESQRRLYVVTNAFLLSTGGAEWAADDHLLTAGELRHPQAGDESVLRTVYLPAVCLQTGNSQVYINGCMVMLVI